MGKYLCDCGNLLSNTSVPNEVQLRVYTDEEYWRLMGAESASDLISPSIDVWKCAMCERLFVFKKGSLYKKYKLDV